MSNFTHGMNIDEVTELGNRLQTISDEMNAFSAELDGKVESTTWAGPDADTFKGTWWPDHRDKLCQIIADLHGFGQSALNNATAQCEISSV